MVSTTVSRRGSLHEHCSRAIHCGTLSEAASALLGVLDGAAFCMPIFYQNHRHGWPFLRLFG